MAITKATVSALRAVWGQDIQTILDKELEIVKNALVDAESIETIRQLQGKARAYKAMVKFPEYVSNFVETPAE